MVRQQVLLCWKKFHPLNWCAWGKAVAPLWTDNSCMSGVKEIAATLHYISHLLSSFLNTQDKSHWAVLDFHGLPGRCTCFQVHPLLWSLYIGLLLMSSAAVVAAPGLRSWALYRQWEADPVLPLSAFTEAGRGSPSETNLVGRVIPYRTTSRLTVTTRLRQLAW